jgi:hypothetical protein
MRSIVKVLAALVFCLTRRLPSLRKLSVLLAVDAEDPLIRQSITSAIYQRDSILGRISGIDVPEFQEPTRGINER